MSNDKRNIDDYEIIAISRSFERGTVIEVWCDEIYHDIWELKNGKWKQLCSEYEACDKTRIACRKRIDFDLITEEVFGRARVEDENIHLKYCDGCLKSIHRREVRDHSSLRLDIDLGDKTKSPKQILLQHKCQVVHCKSRAETSFNYEGSYYGYIVCWIHLIEIAVYQMAHVLSSVVWNYDLFLQHYFLMRSYGVSGAL